MLRDIVDIIEKESHTVGQEIIPSLQALGRVAAQSLKSGRDLPRFDVSALDGFACKGKGELFTVKSALEPGEKVAFRLNPGEAVFVATGAAIPAGTRFLPVEYVREEGSGIRVEEQSGKPKRGEIAKVGKMAKIWKKGYWIHKGDPATAKGEAIKPRTMELLALAGLEQIAVYRRPSVSILSTGNELKKGIIPNSNQYLLSGLVKRDGGEVSDALISGDEEEEIVSHIRKMAGADLLLVTGGTAKGKKDMTRSSFESCGATILLQALPIVPGKTMTFGKLHRTPFFILPGNPRALRALYEIFVKPCLVKLAGGAGKASMGKASIPGDVKVEPQRIHLIPITLSHPGKPTITSLYADEPNGFIILERTTQVRAGQEVTIQWTAGGPVNGRVNE
jgi:molybdopterin molybdotransferase